MKAKLEFSLSEAKNITSFFFTPESPLRYSAGQFIEMTIKHDDPDERGTKRWFTISSSPGHEQISITTKHADSPSSFKKALWDLSEGDEVDISQPLGDFVLPKDTSQPLVFVAGGIGITPFHSIVEWLDINGLQRSIQMIYMVHDKSEIVFESMFNKSYIELETITGDTKLTAAKIVEFVGGIDGKQVYISGPEPMTETIVAQFGKLGVNQHQLITDYFPGYSEV